MVLYPLKKDHLHSSSYLRVGTDCTDFTTHCLWIPHISEHFELLEEGVLSANPLPNTSSSSYSFIPDLPSMPHREGGPVRRAMGEDALLALISPTSCSSVRGGAPGIGRECLRRTISCRCFANCSCGRRQRPSGIWGVFVFLGVAALSPRIETDEMESVASLGMLRVRGANPGAWALCAVRPPARGVCPAGAPPSRVVSDLGVTLRDVNGVLASLVVQEPARDDAWALLGPPYTALFPFASLLVAAPRASLAARRALALSLPFPRWLFSSLGSGGGRTPLRAVIAGFQLGSLSGLLWTVTLDSVIAREVPMAVTGKVGS